MQVFPNYYKNFKCIADKCKHNCCIGWEIDIDEETYDFYKSVGGKMGKRLKENIDDSDIPHFVLGKNERCPFLNDKNLCDIITELGEEKICTICTEHPRFNNELPDRIETGIGLCCEEAGRIILGQKERVELIKTGDTCYDEFIEIRDKAIELLQERDKPIPQRIKNMLALCGAKMPHKTTKSWVEFFLTLERLDEEWTKVLEKLKESLKTVDFLGFGKYMSERQTEYEQLLIYFIYRHLANAFDEEDLAARAAFAVIGYEMIYAVGAMIFTEKGEFTFEDRVEICRMFSSEIEYSEDNMDTIISELQME